MQSSEGLETQSSTPTHSSSDLATLLLKLLDCKSVSRSPASRTSLLATSLCADVQGQTTPRPSSSTVARVVSRTPVPPNARASAPSTPKASYTNPSSFAAGAAWPSFSATGREAQARTGRGTAEHAEYVFNDMPMTVDMSDVSTWGVSGMDQSGMWWSMGSL